MLIINLQKMIISKIGIRVKKVGLRRIIRGNGIKQKNNIIFVSIEEITETHNKITKDMAEIERPPPFIEIIERIDKM